jgi:hypothetical protein
MIRIQIFCDVCGRGGAHNDGGHTKPHLLRSELRLKGWKTGLPGGSDRCPECARQAAIKVKKVHYTQKERVLHMSVWEFMEAYVGTRGPHARAIHNAADRCGIHTVGGLVDLGYAEIYKLRGVGKETLHTFRAALARAGIELRS